VISETRGSIVRTRGEVLGWLDTIRFGTRESEAVTARAVATRRMASPIASAAASIRSVCFLTSCRRRARLSISSSNSSVAICELLFPSANFNKVALSLASAPDFFLDIMVAPFLNCYQFPTLSRSKRTDKRQRAPFQKMDRKQYADAAKLFPKLTIELGRQCASHRTSSISPVRNAGPQLPERRCGRSELAGKQTNHELRRS